jgi:hypothetical protein
MDEKYHPRHADLGHRRRLRLRLRDKLGHGALGQIEHK